MDIPIACTLTGPELAERRRTILDLVRKARIRTRCSQDGYSYEFQMDADTSEQLKRLVALERQCCPFLSFDITETANLIRLDVTGLPEAVRVIEDFFRRDTE